MFSAKDIMTDQIVFVDPDDNVERAIELMLRHGVSGLPVVDSSDQLLGVVTEFDILDMVEDFYTEKNKVFHYMTRDPETIDVSTPLAELASTFRQRSIRRFPVVDNGRLVGIFS